MNPVVREALNEIAARHDFTLEVLLGKTHLRLALAARRECYEWLRRRRWSYEAIARVFGRDKASIAQAVQTGQHRERRLARYRNYMTDKRRAA